jgi:type IV secretion system protein VirB6
MTIFSDMGQSIDTLLNTFVSQTSSSLIGGLQSTVTVAVSLYFVIFGYLVVGGYIQNTIPELIKKALTMALILGLAFTAAAYQSNVVDVFRGLETGLASMVYKGDASNAYQLLDTSFTSGLDLAGKALEESGKYSLWTGATNLIGWFVVSILICLGTILLLTIAGGYIMLAKIALAILLGIGPLFIVCLLFPAVRRFFDAWAGQVVTYTLIIVLMAVVVSFGLTIFNETITKAQAQIAAGTGSMLAVCAQILIVTLCLAIVALQAPSIASALGGGVGLSMLNPLTPVANAVNAARSTGRNVASTYRGGKAAVNYGKQKGQQAYAYMRRGGSASNVSK